MVTFKLQLLSMDSSPSFTFLPPPPNPNSRILPPYHHHNSSAAHINVPTQPPDLHTTLSALKHLINLSKTTIHSVSNLLPTTTAAAVTATCPYNSNHRVPPSSLFHHYLQCPSSPAPIDPALLDSLHYRNSLQSAHSLLTQENNCFTQTLPNDANTDICLSLDGYHTCLDSNFFYRDCPAVVTFPHDNNNADRILTLPIVLSAECANFTGDGNGDMRDTVDGLFSSCYLVELLPSEYWNVRTEINLWIDYPRYYSYGVLRSAVCCYMSQKEYLLEWIVVNSPFYGVVIDGFMRDHILLLFRLCLKAIAREATGHLVSISRGESTGGNYSFECPVLVRVLTWLASQLAILYGEANGKLFAINMLKQSLLIASSKSLFLFGEQRVSESPDLGDVDGKADILKRSKENDGNTMGMVFLSQVAAAVAALHERSLFETRIKAIRASRSVPVYQRVQEHGYISKKAEEERRKRPNYRPIIEHDGVLWQRGGNQDANKNKSREELLAEERDYKRRRMSYRGKKMKRSTTQVMRGIIDEYMEEIKQANMVDQPPVDATNLALEPSSMNDKLVDNEARIVVPISSKADKAVPQNHWKESVSDISVRSATSDDEIKEKSKKHRHDGQHQEYYTVNESRYGREYFSKNADGRRSSSRSHDYGQRDEQKRSRKYYPSSPDRGHDRSHEQVSRRRDQVHENVDWGDSRQRSKHKDKRSSPIRRNEFEDRYDPSKSHGIDEDDLYSDS